MNMDDNEIEIALLTLRGFVSEVSGNIGHGADIGGDAERCCLLVIGKCKALIERIEQHQKDQEDKHG